MNSSFNINFLAPDPLGLSIGDLVVSLCKTLPHCFCPLPQMFQSFEDPSGCRRSKREDETIELWPRPLTTLEVRLGMFVARGEETRLWYRAVERFCSGKLVVGFERVGRL